MKTFIIILVLTLLSFTRLYGLVDFNQGNSHVTRHLLQPTCLDQEFAHVEISVNWQLNNSYFRLQRSKDPNFSWAINLIDFSGCGSCGVSNFMHDDFGPFVSGEVWYYRVRAVSNDQQYQYLNIGSFTSAALSIVNWVSQVTNQVAHANTPSTEGSYNWFQESREMQGVQISLNPPEISNIYLEQGNNRIRFIITQSFPFSNLDVNVNNTGYTNLYNGSLITAHTWTNSISAFPSIGNYNLKVRYTNISGTIIYREYNVYVVPKSDGLYIDNFCNSIRVWNGHDPSGGIPILLSEGFDAYNVKSQQYYMYSGKDLINCLLSKGFKVYIIDYKFNAQSMENNAAVYQSATRYISSLNNNRKVVATGMSMGGVIVRYACAKAEHVSNPLPISKFVSIDAPQQGATLSSDFQNWRKAGLDAAAQNGSPDSFAEYASNNDAAKQLLNYNAYDPSGTSKNNFFNTLNTLNGDGYPHLVENIGISFSNNQSNPNNGTWLTVQISGIPFINNNTFLLSPDEMAPGSFLPLISVDPIPITDSKFLSGMFLNLLRPITNPFATLVQSKNPTFIKHSSSLDIVNGTSKFSRIIYPSVSGFHDQIPPSIIETMVNAMLEDEVYIQNKTIQSGKVSVARSKLHIGSNVNAQQLSGPVVINTSQDVIFKATVEVNLMDGFDCPSGSEFSAILGGVSCDNSLEYQNRMASFPDEQTELIPSIAIPAEYLNDSRFHIEYNTGQYSNLNDPGQPELLPNPTEGLVYLNGLQDDELDYEVYGMDHKLLLSGICRNRSIDLSELAKGLYLVKLIDKQKTIHNFKVIRN